MLSDVYMYSCEFNCVYKAEWNSQYLEDGRYNVDPLVSADLLLETGYKHAQISLGMRQD